VDAATGPRFSSLLSSTDNNRQSRSPGPELSPGAELPTSRVTWAYPLARISVRWIPGAEATGAQAEASGTQAQAPDTPAKVASAGPTTISAGIDHRCSGKDHQR
jgi:hypothetical protein